MTRASTWSSNPSLAVPSIEQEDAKRLGRERETLTAERTRIINRMKSALARLGIRGFKPQLRKAPQLVEALRTPEDVPIPPNTLAEIRRDYARLAILREQMRAFFGRVRVLDRWRRDHSDRCQARGFIEIGCGRVVEAAWEPYGLSFPQCCNLPIQGICADAMLRAITMVHRRYLAAGIRGGLVATVHDELLAEVVEADAERARDILQQTMIEAFEITFPGAPTECCYRFDRA